MFSKWFIISKQFRTKFQQHFSRKVWKLISQFQHFYRNAEVQDKKQKFRDLTLLEMKTYTATVTKRVNKVWQCLLKLDICKLLTSNSVPSYLIKNKKIRAHTTSGDFISKASTPRPQTAMATRWVCPRRNKCVCCLLLNSL